MRVLITGSNGNLGRRLVHDFSADHEVLGVDIEDLDITDFDAVRTRFSAYKPEIVVNAAAMTAVDLCEDKIELAYAVNAVGTRNLSVASNECQACFVHYSTDFVFDGMRESEPYREYDLVNPVSIYGKSKYAGEEEIRRIGIDYLILRVAWLYGPGGWNFTDWVAEQTTGGNEIRIVTDQFGCPTWVGDVSKQTQHLVSKGARGLYHSVNSGSCSRYEWAVAAAKESGGDVGLIQPITSKDFKQKVPRPKYSVLDNFYLRTQGLEIMRPWQESLRDHLAGS